MKYKYGKYTYEYVKNLIEVDGNILISKEYINCKTKLSIKCKCGEVYVVDFDTYLNKNKTKCVLCRKGTNKLREDFLKLIKSQGATLITNINDVYSVSDVHIKCKCGNDIITKTNYIRKKNKYIM